MDVEKRTTIVAGMNAEPMKQGLREIATEAAKTTAGVTQSVAQMSRSLLDTTRGFDALQRKFVDGYKDAMTYVQAMQTLMNAQKNGRDSLGAYQAILGNLNASFGVMGTAAQDAATKMLTAGKNVAQYKEGLKELIAVMREAQQAAAQEIRGTNLSGLQNLGDTVRRARIAADPYEQRRATQYQADVQTTLNRYAGMRTPDQAKDAAESASVFTAELDKQRAAIDSVFRVSKEYEAGLAAIQAAMDNYNITAEQGAVLQENLTKAFAAANQPLVAQVSNYDKLRASVDAVYAASKAYEAELTKIDQLQSEGLSAGQADQLRQQATARFSAANQPDTYDKQRASIDSVYAASKQYEAELNNIQAVAAKLNLTTAQTDALMDQATARFAAANQPLNAHIQTLNQMHGATGQQSFAMRQLGVQAVQTFSGFATGQPIMMTLIQQGHQVADVMLSAGVSFRSLATAVSAAIGRLAAFLLANPITLIAAAIAAIAAGLALITVRAEQAAQRLSDLGNRLRAVGGDAATRAARATDVEAASRQAAATSPIARSDAFTAGSTLVTAGFAGSRDELEQMIKLSYDLSKVLGSDIPTATKILADGIDDAAGAAQKLHDQLGSRVPGLTQATVDQLKLTQQTQGTAAAFRELQAIIERTAGGAGTETTKLAKAWENFVEQLSGSHSVIGGLGTVLGNMLAGLLNIVTKILETLNKLREFGDWVDSHFPALAALDRRAGLGGGVAASGNNLVGLRPTGATTGFQTFGSPEESIAAGVRQLQTNMDQHKITTLAQQITRWAPPSENDTAAYIKAVAAETGLDPNAPLNVHDKEVARQVIAAIAHRETGRSVAPEIVSRGVDQAFATPSAGLGGVSQKDIDDANKASQNVLLRQRQQNEAEQGQMQRSLDAAWKRATDAATAATGAGRDVGTDKDFKTASDQVVYYTQRLYELRHLHTDLITEQQKLARGFQDQVIVLNQTGAAAKEDADIERQFQIAARGNMVDQAALGNALKAAQDKRTEAMHESVRAMDQETVSQNALAEATAQGGNALDHYINFEKARIMALDVAKVGTKENQQALEEYLGMLERATDAKRTIAAMTMIPEYEKQNEQLELEAKLIGASTDEINRQTAALQARQAMNLKAGETPNAGQQRAIDAAKNSADIKTSVDRQKAAYQELESFGTEVFDTIGNAMADSFKKGADAAKVWQDALGSIVNEVIKEFIKLAILNPLLNSIFGGGRPEIGDVGNAAGNLGQGGSGTGGGGGGLLGSLLGGGGGTGGGGSSGSSGSGGSGLLGSIAGHAGGLFGWLPDQTFGEGFYKGGGFLGQGYLGLTGSSGYTDPGIGWDLPVDVAHTGGLVGTDALRQRMAPSNAFDYAPHFQQGFANDEFAAILHRSERVLTANQNNRLESVLNNVAASGGGQGGRGGGGGGGNVVMNITTPNADSFRASQTQIEARAAAGLTRNQQRNKT